MGKKMPTKIPESTIDFVAQLLLVIPFLFVIPCLLGFFRERELMGYMDIDRWIRER